MQPLHLFEGFGIELEYAIVGEVDLRVLPIADEILASVAGPGATEYEVGAIAWSNELARHLIEVKTNGPVPALTDKLASDFGTALSRIERLAKSHGGRLLPTAMHPTMDPHRDTVLWPHDGDAIYSTYDRIFDCRGHGWSNLQSCHLNLPFCGPEEFGRLHAAVRAVLPLLPALAASSPIVDGKRAPALDYRLQVYRGNQARVPSIIGAIIPEPVFTPDAYQEEILAPMYREMAPLDPEGTLAHEWLNSRGAIARFDRSAIEIRLLDVQETPLADLAIARLVAATVEALDSGVCLPRSNLRALDTRMLASVLDRTIIAAEEAWIEEAPLLEAFGQSSPCTAQTLWRRFYEAHIEQSWTSGTPLKRAMETILQHGSLARRIVRAVGDNPDRRAIEGVYRRLAECLRHGRLFVV